MVKDTMILFGVIVVLAIILFFVYVTLVSNDVGMTTSAMFIILPLIALGIVLTILYRKEKKEQKQESDTRDRYSSNTSN